MRPHFVLLLLLAFALGLRLYLVLSHQGFLGVDGGAYLLSRNDVLGNEPTGAGFPRPPLAPGWLLVPFTYLFGDMLGYDLWSALAAFALIPAFYLLARVLLTRWQALIATAFISVDMLHGEMMVTGALPLLGFALLCIVLWAITKVYQATVVPEPNAPFHWAILPGGAAAAALPFVNHTATGLAAIVVPIYIISLELFGRRTLAAILLGFLRRDIEQQDEGGYGLLNGMTIAVMGLVGLLSALPWYLDVAPGSGIFHYPGPWVYLSGWGDSAWIQFAIAVPVGIWIAWKGKSPPLRSLGVLTALLGTLLIFLSTDETVINIFYRSRYLVMVPLTISIAYIVGRWWLRTDWRLAVPITASLFVLLSLGFVTQFWGQARYSDMATPEVVEALGVIEEDGNGEGVIANGFTLALWVAALNRVPVAWTFTWEPPRDYVETDKDVRCVLGWVDGCDPAQAAERLDVGYVLVDSRFPYYNARAPSIYGAPPELWGTVERAPWLEKVHQEGTVQAWRLAPKS